MKKREYTTGGLRIPRKLNPPWYMDDRNVGRAILGYFALLALVVVLAMTFGWGGSHW